MREIELDAGVVKDLVARAYTNVTNNKLVPLSSLLGLELGKDGLTIRSFNGIESLAVKSALAKADEDLEVTVNATILNSLVQKVTTKTIGLSITDKGLHVRANGNYDLDIVMDNGKPLIVPHIEGIAYGNPASVPVDGLQKAIKYGEVAISKTSDVPFETGIYFGKDGYAMASDEAKCAIVPVKLFDDNLIMRASSLKLMALLGGPSITFEHDGSNFVAKGNDGIVAGSLLGGVGDFPKDILLGFITLPEGSKVRYVTANKDALLSALDRLAIFMSTQIDEVIVGVKGGTLTIATADGKAVESIAVEGTGDTPSLHYLLTPLREELTAYDGAKLAIRFDTDGNIIFGNGSVIYVLSGLQEGN